MERKSNDDQKLAALSRSSEVERFAFGSAICEMCVELAKKEDAFGFSFSSDTGSQCCDHSITVINQPAADTRLPGSDAVDSCASKCPMRIPGGPRDHRRREEEYQPPDLLDSGEGPVSRTEPADPFPPESVGVWSCRKGPRFVRR